MLIVRPVLSECLVCWGVLEDVNLSTMPAFMGGQAPLKVKYECILFSSELPMINPNSRDLFSVLQMIEFPNKSSGRKEPKTRIIDGLMIAGPVVFSFSLLAYFIVMTSVASYSSILM